MAPKIDSFYRCGLHNLAENLSWAWDVNGRDQDETETSVSRDRDETETLTIFLETRPRRDRDETLVRLRPRRRDRDHNPATHAFSPLSPKTQQSFCQQSCLFQFAKSLLVANLRCQRFRVHMQGDVIDDMYPISAVYQRIFKPVTQILHWLIDSGLCWAFWCKPRELYGESNFVRIFLDRSVNGFDKNSVAVAKHHMCVKSFYADGAGLLDPCEKGTIDAAESLTNQQREDITSVAQVTVIGWEHRFVQVLQKWTSKIRKNSWFSSFHCF